MAGRRDRRPVVSCGAQCSAKVEYGSILEREYLSHIVRVELTLLFTLEVYIVLERRELSSNGAFYRSHGRQRKGCDCVAA